MSLINLSSGLLYAMQYEPVPIRYGDFIERESGGLHGVRCWCTDHTWWVLIKHPETAFGVPICHTLSTPSLKHG